MSERSGLGASLGLAGGGGSPELVRRAIDLTYEARQRALSLRWSIINAIILLVFAYDLTRWCADSSVALYLEAGAAGAALAGATRHVLRLLRPPRAQPLPITPEQRRLLALQHTSLDGSFRLVEEDAPEKKRRDGSGPEAASVWDTSLPRTPPQSLLPQSLSPQSLSPPSLSPQSLSPPRAPASPPRSPPSPTSQDRFIADSATLNDYLKQQSERSAAERSAAESSAAAGGGACGGAAPRYVVAERAPRPPGAAPAPPQPRLWWRLNIDPERLTQFNLNLRLWIHVTILARLVREMDVVEGALRRAGLAGLGGASTERLRALAAAAHPPNHPLHPLRALLPFLEPFQDQRYVVQRIRELARGGCLSEYRWCGGGADWGEGRPADAELVLALVACYLDAQLPPPPARPFSALHLAPAPPAPGAPPAPAALRIVRVSQRPPHYALALDGELLEVGGGRNNLLHVLLLLVAAAARRAPPASPLQRHNLGPAGLNMLWIIGR